MYHSEESEAPKIIRVDTEVSVRFKGKDGVFDIYNRKTKENKQVKEITILPVNDSRFTVKAAQNDDGAFIFSAMYRSTKQNITVLKSESGKVSVVKQGTWEAIKDANLKYTRVLYCIIIDGKSIERAEFELQGIGLVQWGKIRTQDNVAITLAVSSEKTFKTPKGMFYEMVSVKKDIPKLAEETAAKFMADSVKESFDSFDDNYKYRKSLNNEEKVEENSDQASTPTGQVPTSDAEKDLKLSDVPF